MSERREMNNQNAETPKNTAIPKAAESFAVMQLRETYSGFEPANAEDEARMLSRHIRDIDRELEALSEERGKLAERCLKAVKQSWILGDNYGAIAKNDYRTAPRSAEEPQPMANEEL